MKSKFLVITMALMLIVSVGCATVDTPLEDITDDTVVDEEPVEDDFELLDEDDDFEIESVI